MFFCEKCRVKNAWPEGWGFKSYGPCEVCGISAECHEIASRYLPAPKSVS